MMTSSGRAQAIFTAISQSTPGFSQLSAAEQQQVMANLTAIFGTGDLTYLQTYAQILPSSMAASAGASVVTSGGPSAQTGSVTSAAQIVGYGTLE